MKLQTHYYSSIESILPHLLSLIQTLIIIVLLLLFQFLIVSYCGIDHMSENEFSTNIIETDIEPEPQFSKTFDLFDSERLSDTNSAMNTDITFNTKKSFNFESVEWAVQNKIPHTSLNNLLIILRKHKCFSTLPKDAILQTKQIDICKIRDVHPSKY